MGIVMSVASILIGRHDSNNDKTKDILEAIEQIQKDISKISEDASEREAIRSRISILRFNDELYNGIHHSQEYFMQVLDDIELYSTFCSDHPKFANGRTKAAAEHIKDEYDRLFREHKL